jgi:TonB family protein
MAQKIRIMKNRQQPSDEEIQGYMNFERLLESRKIAVEKSSITSVIKWGTPLLLAAAISLWFSLSKDEAPVAHDVEHGDSRPNANIITPIEPLDSVTETKPAEETVRKEKVPQKSSSTEKRESRKEKQTVEKHEAETNDIGYTQAEPLNGYSDLYTYFNTNLVYPAEALKDSIEGIQTISFIINEEGKIEQIQAINSLGEPFEKECRRLIENMPQWKPATLNGKPVASKISLPLTFQIQKIKK